MAFIAVCQSSIQIVPNGSGPGAAHYFVDGVLVQLPMPYCSSGWVIETFTLGDLAKIQEIEMYTHAIFDLLFVAVLCFSFYMGFHKGGQR